ncbi:MAG: hypothetical protein U0872_10520 [Planctomycetaceae bacterium]
MSARKVTRRPERAAFSSELLSSLKWNSQASPALRAAAKSQNVDEFCRAWLANLSTTFVSRKQPPQGMTAWALPKVEANGALGTLLQKVFPAATGRPARSVMKTARPVEKHLLPLIGYLTERSESWTPAETIVAGELLLIAGRQLASAEVWSLWSRLLQETREPGTNRQHEQPEELLLREGEVPFLAGGLLEPWQDAKAIREQGRRILVRELMSRTDRDGTPHAELLPRLPFWLASLVRATIWADRLQISLWNPEERQRLSLVLERAVPLYRPGGKLAFSNGETTLVLPLLAAADQALELTGPAQVLLRTLQEGNRAPAKKRRTTSEVQIMPSVQSDWARMALLRSDWSPQADSVAISHHRPLPLLDLAALGQPVLHGPWGLEVQIGDAGIELAPEWSCSCWMSDPDADYLELQMQGPGGLRVERRVLLSRQDHFLLLADCVGARGIKPADARNDGAADSSPSPLALGDRSDGGRGGPDAGNPAESWEADSSRLSPRGPRRSGPEHAASFFLQRPRTGVATDGARRRTVCAADL